MNGITDFPPGRRRLTTALVRVAFPIALGAVCIAIILNRADRFDWAKISSHVLHIPLSVWGAALLAAGVSFWAVGRYDLILHRHLGTGVRPKAAISSGATAIALSQMLGLSVFTGALARWRMLPWLSPAQIGVLSGLVAFCFMASLAAVTGMALTVLPRPAGVPVWLIIALVCVIFLIPPISLLWPEWQILGRRGRLPSLIAQGQLVAMTFVDTLAACVILWLLMPEMYQVSFASLYPVYLLALGASLISGTPGGIGPFELTLVMLLPQVPDVALLSAVLGYRVIYYALPACIAAVFLLRPLKLADLPEKSGLSKSLLYQAPRAECGLWRQGQGTALAASGSVALVRDIAQSSVLMFDPICGPVSLLIPALKAHARNRNTIPCFYKLSARHAVEIRKHGFQVHRIADEAVIDTRSFRVDMPGLGGLRRKLRKARRSGVETFAAPGPLPRMQMQRVARDWATRRGGERGFSMGRFDHSYLFDQKVILAWQGNRLVGFASFHHTDQEWCLDLMRFSSDAPEGTMHMLIATAIDIARREGQDRLSLAAVPNWEGLAFSALTRKLRAGAGLRQFKSSFAPRWEPLYAAAPSRLSLLLSLVDIARAVHEPAPLNPELAHDIYENYEFASRGQA